ncbi:hypothetical protein Rt10032_c17g5815 [Rhodotorula toruloides]|uniref:Uncharacterized protein n=1 Tax=Rhodotorula toruloides TaxID=5286 RepID=A0A511KN40_RHOTO|nr:hypothetical protein Rt10032_c17g5815 [Rhodotorula toruloides]
MSGPDYSQKSSAQIIEEQAASLNAKEDRFNKSASYDTHATTTSEESGVNESRLDEFPGAEGISVEHGGDPRTHGSHAADFDDLPAGEDRKSWLAKTQPGSINVSGQAHEALRTIDASDDGSQQNLTNY